MGGEPQLLESVRARLEGRGHDVRIQESGAACLQTFSSEGADLVIACLPLVDMGGAALLRSLREVGPQLNVVVIGRDGDIQGAAAAFELNAFEYIEDPVRDAGDVLAAVGSALGSRRGDVQLRYLKQREASSSSWAALVGQSEEMRQVVEVVRRVNERTVRGAPPTILIRGETGTGKGLLARCIHYNGVRRNNAFVEVNCAAIPANLLESELFGHERGAFTDAKTAKAGLFETADQGTLFLDEIGSLTIDLQAKLLTAIEEKRIRRLGGRQSSQVNVQIIAASHADLSGRARTGEFRADLYHRLNVVSVTMPPLRRRGEDKVVLARTFVEAICREYAMPLRRLSEEAVAYILEYPWPGNVRELRNQIERIVLLGNSEIIDRGDFARPSMPPPGSNRPGQLAIALPDQSIGLEEVERELIRLALERFAGNVSSAARYLKVSRQTLMYRIKKHQLG